MTTELTQMTTELAQITQDLQPFITIGTQGRVANGKSTLIKALAGIDPMKFKKEIVKNMTIKLGFTNAKFYKCKRCPKPFCYQANKPICEACGDPNELALHVSFVDSPGHNDLQTTALSGAANMNYCLLVMSADCEQDPETNEHYKAIKFLGLNHKTIGIHNKIDLVTKAKVIENFEQIKQTYDLKYIIPLCAQFSFGLNYLIQFLVESIPNPINEELIEKINKPLKASILRSFDINKPGTLINDLKGAVIGCSIKEGKITIGDRVKIIPGIIQKDGKCIQLEAHVVKLRTDNTDLEVAYPGGLIGVELSIDSALSKEDRLVGNFIIGPTDTENKIFKNCKISYTEWVEDSLTLKKDDVCVGMLGTIKRNVKILKINKELKEINFIANADMAGSIGDSIIITKNNQIQLHGLIIQISDN
jgi:translation initiation factor 2 subunit 3